MVERKLVEMSGYGQLLAVGGWWVAWFGLPGPDREYQRAGQHAPPEFEKKDGTSLPPPKLDTILE